MIGERGALCAGPLPFMLLTEVERRRDVFGVVGVLLLGVVFLFVVVPAFVGVVLPLLDVMLLLGVLGVVLRGTRGELAPLVEFSSFSTMPGDE